jgi:hypothetical protein
MSTSHFNSLMALVKSSLNSRHQHGYSLLMSHPMDPQIAASNDHHLMVELSQMHGAQMLCLIREQGHSTHSLAVGVTRRRVTAATKGQVPRCPGQPIPEPR